MHVFLCPHCQASFRVDPAVLGGALACPACKKLVQPILPPAPGGANEGWQVARGGKKAGPFAWQNLLALVAAGKVRADDMILAPGSPRWLPAANVHGLLTPMVAKPVLMAAVAAPVAAARPSAGPLVAKPIAKPRSPQTLLIVAISGGGLLALVIALAFFLSGSKNKEKPKEVARAKPKAVAPDDPDETPVPKKADPKTVAKQKDTSSDPTEDPSPKKSPDTPKGGNGFGLKKIDLGEIEAEFLDTLNRYRRASGLGLVAYDPMLVTGCRAHAEYLALNLDRPEIRSAQGVQSEFEKLPGYSAEGKKAAEASMTAIAEPEVALELFMGRLQSRTPLLNPELQRIGLGAACTEGGNWVSVIDPTRGYGDYLVTYPAADQKDVPYLFSGGPELPNRKMAAGFPVSVQFPRTRKVTQATIKLVDAKGTELPAKLWTPEQPLIARYPFNIVGLIPEKPLNSGVKYTVQFSARVDDQAIAKFWNFTSEDDNASSEAATQQVLARVNEIRKLAGLDAVELDPELHRACRNHARYLVLNLEHPAVAGLGAHDEDLSLPGATKEGKEAGKKSVIALGDHDPRDSIDGWMDTLYHRVPMLEPNLKRVGFGAAKGKGWMSVLNVSTGKTQGRPREVLYPVPDQKDVPLQFPPGGEIPDPIPDDKDKQAGYPITAFFPFNSPLVNATGSLKEAGGNALEVWFSSPEKPANSKYVTHQGNTVCLIAKDPLKPATKYTVEIAGTREGKKWEKTWSFTTMSIAPGNWPKIVVDRLNEFRRVANVPEVAFDAELSKGCQAHADYLARNGVMRGKEGFVVNDEDPKLPGFSESGQEAARRTSVFFGTPRPTAHIDDLMGTLSQRPGLLEPRLRRVSVGCAFEPGKGWVSAIDASTGVGEATVSLYPGPGQQKVPPKGFDRLPDGNGEFAGYPISVIFPRTAVLKNVRATLTDGAGKKVDIHLSTPDMPLDPNVSYPGIGIHSRQPLQPGQSYSVSVNADVSGKPFQQSWRFETATK